MSLLKRIQRGETEFAVFANRRRFFLVAAALILLSFGGLIFRGLNLGVEFTGGLLVTVENPNGASVAETTDAIRSAGIGDVTVQEVDGGASIRIRTPEFDSATEGELMETISTVAGAEPSDLARVGPTFGALVLQRFLIALAVFLGFVVLYISWRLEFKMAMVAIAALFHDLSITVGVYALTGFPVTPATVIAVLTVLGYSMYDTVVVFDKMDEIVSVESRAPYSAIVDKSTNIVLGRSLGTTLSALLPVGSILLIGAGIMGATGLTDFALALFVGMIAGAYSSLFLAGPLLAMWKLREEEWAERQERYGDVEVTADVTDVLRQQEREERERRRQGPPTLTGEVGRRRDT
ncbi:MAG: protein translocase subunit SecF [Acidimicrobiia bacterium]|nr:protein translocase subunit SecF [Acidimicrobiia bacterium]